MTKNLELNIFPDIELNKKQRFKFWFTETDFYKWTITGMGSIISFFGVLSAKYIKGRNDDLHNVIKKVSKIDSRLSKVENSLIVNRTDGSKMGLSDYVQQISHKIDNHDIGEASALGLILEKIEKLESKHINYKNKQNEKQE